MSYDGSLINIFNPSNGSYEKLPYRYMYKESYKVTPNRRQDIDSGRNANGKLIRNVLDHTASTVSFNTPTMWNSEIANLMAFINSRYVIEKEKKIKLKYYCPDIDDYKIGEFYVPDIEFPIIRVEDDKILYSNITIKFIEY